MKNRYDNIDNKRIKCRFLIKNDNNLISNKLIISEHGLQIPQNHNINMLYYGLVSC